MAYEVKNLIKLKDDSFYYINKKYITNRYISTDEMIYIEFDMLSFFRVFTGNGINAKATRVYLKDNEVSYPISTIEQAIDLINTYTGKLDKFIGISPTHFISNKKTSCSK